MYLRHARQHTRIFLTALIALVVAAGIGKADPTERWSTVGFSQFHNLRIQSLAGAAPMYPEGDVVLGEVPFSIPVGGNNAWSSDDEPGENPHILEIVLDEAPFRVVAAHFLINSKWGRPGPVSYATIEFFGLEGGYVRKDLVGDDDIRDHLLNFTTTNEINGVTTKEVFTAGEGMFNQVRLDKLEVDISYLYIEGLDRIRVTDKRRKGGSQDHGGRNHPRIGSGKVVEEEWPRRLWRRRAGCMKIRRRGVRRPCFLMFAWQ